MTTSHAIKDPIHLAMLRQVLDDHCSEFGLATGGIVGDNLRRRISYLFKHGISRADKLLVALRADRSM